MILNLFFVHSNRYKLSVYGQPSREAQPLGWYISTNADAPVRAGHFDLGNKESITQRIDESKNDNNEATAKIVSDILHVRRYPFRSTRTHTHITFFAFMTK